MSRLSKLFHEITGGTVTDSFHAVENNVLETTVRYLMTVEISGDEKKKIALAVMTALHQPISGPLADAEIQQISGAIEYVVAQVKKELLGRLGNLPTPAPATPTVAA